MHPIPLPNVVRVSTAWFPFSCLHNGSQQNYNLTSLFSLGHAFTGSPLSYGVHSVVFPATSSPFHSHLCTYIRIYVAVTRLRPPSSCLSIPDPPSCPSLLPLPSVPPFCPFVLSLGPVPPSHPLSLLKEEKQRLKAEKSQQEGKKKVILISVCLCTAKMSDT